MPEGIILLVEDNSDDRDLAMRVLQQRRLARDVVVARDGVDALDYLFGTGAHAGRDTLIQPDVIFLDLKLPKLDGLEVLRSVRDDARTRHLPVVVLTSSDDTRDISASYQLGASSYVRKPVDFPSFAATVEQLGWYWLRVNQPDRSASVEVAA